MEFEKIEKLMKLLNESNLMDFELKLNDGSYLRMNKFKKLEVDKQPKNKVYKNNEQEENTQSVEQQINQIQQLQQPQSQQSQQLQQGNVVKAPIVGTFYESNSPTNSAFVKEGDTVKKGDILCIIEAMKVMNEIKSPFDGQISQILVKNEDMVEYNQPLFVII